VVECYGSDSVLVVPESKWNDPFFDPESVVVTNPEKSVVLKRFEIAVWDCDSVWKVNSMESTAPNTGVRESKQKLANLLASLNTAKGRNKQTANTNDASLKSQFVSSRERKAANSKTKNNTRTKKGK
jgi:hypothetical protein